MNKKYILSLLTPFLFLFQFVEADIEETVVTGSLIKVLEDDSSPIEVITSEEYDQPVSYTHLTLPTKCWV